MNREAETQPTLLNGHSLHWTVLAAQDVARLGQMGEQRIVAGVLAMVRVEAPKRPRDRGHGATTVPSTSMVRRGSRKRAMASVTSS